MGEIRLPRLGEEPAKPLLPRSLKVLRFDELTIIVRWNGLGWVQVSDEEKAEILRDFETNG